MFLDLTFFSQVFQPLIWVKMILLLFLILYGFLSFVIFNQVRVMNQIVKEVQAGSLLFLLSILNFLFVVSLFFYSLAIL